MRPRWRAPGCWSWRLGLTAALLGLACSGATAPPNVLLIVLDDLGYGDLGSYGGGVIRTPHLDGLAAEGMRFTRFYAGGPTCSPGRAALLTGRHPSELGIRAALTGKSQRILPADVATIPQVLAPAGYASGHFGKWHLGGLQARGFEQSVVSAARYRDPVLWANGEPRGEEGHLTTILTDRAIAFLEDNRDRRFLLNLWYLAPHYPYDPPDDWASRYPATNEGRYSALVSHVDEQIGRLLARLRALDLERNTLVVVTSDNGGGPKRMPTNGALRGYKRELFEGGIRVPLLVRWPGTIPAGSKTEAVALALDWLPTLAELAGLEPPAGVAGRSLTGILRGDAPRPREEPLFWEGKPAAPAATGTNFAVRRGPWKLVRQSNDGEGRPQLFDLDRDAREREDRSAARPDLVAQLEHDLAIWRLTTTPIRWTIDRTDGSVARQGDRIRFEGGQVGLAPNARFRVDHGDLSFHVRVVPRGLGVEQTLAEHPGSWRLWIDPTGHVHLELRAQRGESRPVELESSAPIVPGVATDVAFTIYGRSKLPSLVRLYVRGEPEARADGPVGLAVSEDRIWLGGGGTFRGTLDRPTFFLAALTAAELARWSADPM